MRLTFIGSGSAFTTDGNYNSNMLLESDTGARLLIDCGSDARHALAELGLSHRDIDAVYISHLHADHVGGLEWLGFSRKFDATCERPRLYTSSHLVQDLWTHSLCGGMRSLQGEVADINTFFDVQPIPKNGGFTWEDVYFRLVQTIHIMDGFYFVPSFGLLFEINAIRAFLTTDTQFAPEQISDFYEQADIIFHDCETSNFPSGVHAHYEKLKTLDPRHKERIWLYHYQPGPLPDAAADGFKGFVAKGQCFDFSSKSVLL
jgi:ribonuclease BN (tRNA processing enzyme)